MRSARYAGDGASDEENLAKLLDEVPDDGDRRVAYVCALAYAEPGGETRVFTERCEQDGWSTDAQQCFLGLASMKEASRCEASLTSAQVDVRQLRS